MRMNLKKKVIAGAGVAAMAATLAPVIAASPAGALGVREGNATMSVLSGDSATPFALSLPQGAACAEDSAAGSWLVSSFMVPTGTDIANLPAFDPGIGPTPSDFGTTYADFRQPLWEPGGNAYVSRSTVNATPPDPTGPILQPTTFDFNPGYSAGDIPAGSYTIGIACLDETNTIQQWWDTTVTVTASASDTGTSGISWVQGTPVVNAPPTAPAGVVVTPGDGQLSVAFGAVTATPAVTSYTATATPTGGGTPVTATGAAGPLAITGLTNGTTYDVTVTATNTEGTSPASAVVTGTPAQAALDGPDVTATPAIEALDVSWTAPSNGPAPTGYSVTTNTGFSATVTGLSTTITGLTAGTPVTVTVTPLYSDATIATPGTATATPLSSGVLIQNITATRPAGALVLTQDCLADPTCTVNLTTGALDASGTYYTATGTLYELTVTDTRDVDAGWSVKGDLADTFTTTGDSFDSRALGWDPAVTYDAPASPSGYDPAPVEGVTIAPNTSDNIKNGTAVLFSAAPGAGLGVAKANAGLTLQIPVSAAAGTYTAQLAISVS